MGSFHASTEHFFDSRSPRSGHFAIIRGWTGFPYGGMHDFSTRIRLGFVDSGQVEFS